jgi:hypothetical protein
VTGVEMLVIGKGKSQGEELGTYRVSVEQWETQTYRQQTASVDPVARSTGRKFVRFSASAQLAAVVNAYAVDMAGQRLHSGIVRPLMPRVPMASSFCSHHEVYCSTVAHPFRHRHVGR